MAAAATASSSAVLLCAAACFVVLTAAGAAHAADVQTAGSHHQGNTKQPRKAGGGDLVMNSCANVRAHDWSPPLTRKLCESTLRSSNRSAAAKDPRDMALVALDLLQSAAAEADGVLRRSGSAAPALAYCRLDYAAVARAVPMCRAMVQEYEPVYPGPDAGSDCFECAARLGSAAASCWGHVLADDEVAKVVSEEVREVFQRAALVRAMIEEMISFGDDKH